ncbi:hypothetical protein [Streptomyces sp. NBC_01768]|uniref:hypothetical protein n=1 Tax=Streptomyces sp. NBC_01768 TaxID=2975938 RepID=UPI002DDA5BB1|nr:hypothetical protein [Streptomyces sp. NBC_01768]WSC31823.1 hypothetical protein OG902_36820 [Streptomyces sp. NBC_01768]
MKTRIEFKGFVDVYDDEPLTTYEARRWVETALRLGYRHAESFGSHFDTVTFVSLVGDDD